MNGPDVVTFAGGGSKLSALDAIAAGLRFPDWFGRNLDALADLLADPRPDTVLVWEDWPVLADADPAAFAGILEVLRERAEAPGFAVLLPSG